MNKGKTMKVQFRSLVTGLAVALLLSACTTTTVSGTNNEKYKTEKAAVTEAPVTEAPKDEFVFMTPKEDEIPPFYWKVRVPGVKPYLFAFSDSEGMTQLRVFGRMKNGEDRGFYPVRVEKESDLLCAIEEIAKKRIEIHEEKPGTPRREDRRPAAAEGPGLRWNEAPEGNGLYYLKDRNGEYQFRRWAMLGEQTGFYPCNDGGILIAGGIPDAVRIEDEWVQVRILNPLTFAYTPQIEEPEVEEEVIIHPPETEEVRTEAPWTEAPRTEAPWTEAPVTEAPVTEPEETEPVTEPPETEPPETEPEETEPEETEPVTEPPETEPPETTEADADAFGEDGEE